MNLKAQTFLLRVSFLLVRVLPRWSVSPLSRWLGRLAPHLLRRDSRLIAANVQRVFDMNAHSAYQKRFQQQVFQSQIAIGLETFKFMLWPERYPLKLEGFDTLQKTLEPMLGRGFIIITAHFGSWELVAKVVAQASGRKFNALAKPSKAPAFTQLLEEMRVRNNTAVLWTDRKNLLREMMRILKEGESLGFVMDQKPEGRRGPLVDFFGIPTEFVSGPAKLALRHEVPVLAVFCMRIGPWHYRIHTQAVTCAGSRVPEDEDSLTQSMAAAIESFIRLYPEQWLWNYKRWRHLPNIKDSGAHAASP